MAIRDSAGNVLRRPDVDACIEHVRRHAIGVLVVDPFVETHAANENSNDQMKAVAAMFREIAQKGDCSVLLVHHTAKPPQGSSDGHAGNMNTARGASALPGIARVVQTLFSMSPSDAEKLNVSAENRHRYIVSRCRQQDASSERLFRTHLKWIIVGQVRPSPSI
ncbi:AAA family ATPase, partial [Magnetospirillum sp. SS-4]|uniref:AAA family ATPase n=1 Tax=Magnetospirillum sp. SS-4 TaxID=2681465 RepID=UPI0034CDC8CC